MAENEGKTHLAPYIAAVYAAPMGSTLAPDERSIWQGAPATGVHFSPQDIFAVPFSILWLALVSGIGVQVITGEASEVDPIGFFIFPLFITVGLYMLVGRFLVDMAIRKRTRYVLTTRRAIIEGGLFSTTTRSVNLAAVAEISFRAGRNSRGSIQFGSNSATPFGMLPRSWPGAANFMPPAFDGIDDAQRVYDLVLKAQRDAQLRP